jgi:SAM-dependent methyltransferase
MADLSERLSGAGLAALELLTVHVGLRLGLYRTLRDLGSADPHRLADAAGVHPRYAREWLEQQAVAGIVEVVDGEFRLPDDHVAALLAEEDQAHVAPLARLVAGIAGVVPEVVDAFRTGEGVPYRAYGADTSEGIAALNRPMFRGDLAKVWLAALPDVYGRLCTCGGRVLDLGCGQGWSSIALAEALPGVRVDGVDLDPGSVRRAREAADLLGLSGRVRFTNGDAGRVDRRGYDLVCFFEALHDMADPVAVLRRARDLLTPGGVVLVADGRVAETFTAPGDARERRTYAFSVLHCLPATRAEGAVEEAGAVLRPSTVRGYADRAGLAYELLPVDNEEWHFYRLS